VRGINIDKLFEDKTLKPLKNISRAEAAELIWQTYKYFTQVKQKPEEYLK
jgi:hypothetical protein